MKISLLTTLSLVVLTLVINSANAHESSRIGHTCTLTADCSPPYTICTDNLCQHKGVFPLTWLEIAGLVILGFTAVIAVTAGVGGGALFTPLLVICFGFDAR
jgi:hypothetical protein